MLKEKGRKEKKRKEKRKKNTAAWITIIICHRDVEPITIHILAQYKYLHQKYFSTVAAIRAARCSTRAISNVLAPNLGHKLQKQNKKNLVRVDIQRLKFGSLVHLKYSVDSERIFKRLLLAQVPCIARSVGGPWGHWNAEQRLGNAPAAARSPASPQLKISPRPRAVPFCPVIQSCLCCRPACSMRGCDAASTFFFFIL